VNYETRSGESYERLLPPFGKVSPTSPGFKS
jgi:hypothetical protein